MRIDREITIEKFDREVSILRDQAPALTREGCYVVRTAFPEIDALIVPTRHLAIGAPLEMPVSPGGIILPGSQVQPRQVQLQLALLPFAFTSMTFGVRCSLDDFDLRAPSITFRHPLNWQLLPFEQLPKGTHIVDGKDMPVVQPNHPASGVPFFCMRGVREYHEHPQHSGDEWLMYRGSINVFATLMAVARCCCKNVAPALIMQPPLLRVEWVL